MSPTPLFDRRLLVVSGKGGVGKSMVAAILASAAQATGKRVLLVEVEGRDPFPALLGVPSPGFRELEAPQGFSVLSITARDALLEYLWLFFRMGTVSRALRKARVVDVATEAIPGFRDVMAAGKLYELTQWRDTAKRDGRRPYDLVVVDAPPTGQLLPFLESPKGYRHLVRVGRPARQLVSIDRLFREQARVALVAVPEEMSVVETVESVDALRRAGFGEPTIVANQVLPAPFPKGTRAAAGRLSPKELTRVLVEVGAEASEEDGAELLEAARQQDRRVQIQRRHLARLSRAAPIIELPFVFSPHLGSVEVEHLAQAVVAA